MITPPRILLVDDDAVVRNLLETILVREGGEAIGAADAFGAIWQLEWDGRFDVILASFTIRGGDGLDVLEAAKSRAPAARRILMTSGLDAPAQERARGLAEAILLKPLDRSALVEQVFSSPGSGRSNRR